MIGAVAALLESLASLSPQAGEIEAAAEGVVSLIRAGTFPDREERDAINAALGAVLEATSRMEIT